MYKFTKLPLNKFISFFYKKKKKKKEKKRKKKKEELFLMKQLKKCPN